MLHFFGDKTRTQSGVKMVYSNLIDEMCVYVASKCGFLYPHVSKLFREERTPECDGYKNIIDGILSIRMGCVIQAEYIYGIELKPLGLL